MGSRIDIDDNLVIERYNELKNLKKVAKSFNVSLRPIVRILKKNNIELTNRRYDVNHSFFEVIDTEEKAYFLGLLYADGNVSKNVVSISLQEQDKSILEKLKNSLYYTGPLISIKKKDKRKQQWKLSITSEELVNNLFTHGLYHNKGTTLQFPNTIPPSLFVHFIRGYFDGDGCIYTNPKNHDYLFSIVAPETFLLKIQELIIKDLSLTKTKLYNPKNCKDTQLHILTYQGKKNILFIKNWLYKDATVYLKRKKDKFFNI
jgi:intein-encoded DNA endonuclease-like protein